MANWLGGLLRPEGAGAQQSATTSSSRGGRADRDPRDGRDARDARDGRQAREPRDRRDEPNSKLASAGVGVGAPADLSAANPAPPLAPVPAPALSSPTPSPAVAPAFADEAIPGVPAVIAPSAASAAPPRKILLLLDMNGTLLLRLKGRLGHDTPNFSHAGLNYFVRNGASELVHVSFCAY